MTEWGIPFDHIEREWTNRQFAAMLRARNARVAKMNAAARRASKGGGGGGPGQMTLREFKAMTGFGKGRKK